MGGLEGPPKPPGARRRPGGAVAPLGIAWRFWGLEGPPKPPGARRRPGGAVAPLGIAWRFWGLEGPPKPPGARRRPGGAVAPLGIAWRFWSLEGPPKPPALGDAPAEPWRPSRMLSGFGGLEGSRSRGDVVAGALELAPATAQGGSSRPGGAVALLGILRARTGLLEDGLELELAADRPVGLHGLESRHRVVVDVAVLVEAPLAVYALGGIGGGARLSHWLTTPGDVLRLLDLRRSPLDGID